MKLIIFTTCKPFIGDDYWRQEQAIKSWINLKNIEKKIIIIGNDVGTEEICKKYNLIHRPDVKKLHNIPYLHSMLEIGASYANDDDYLLWTNSDMIYYDEMIKNILSFDKIKKKNNIDNFCLIGGRIDWHNPKILKDLSRKFFSDNIHMNFKNSTAIIQKESSFNECSKHPLCGIDYTIHSKSTFINKIDKNLVIAGTRHDMILVGTSIKLNYFTCNITNTNFVIHQNHGYPKNYNHSINNNTENERQKILNKLIKNNNRCHGYQAWIHQSPIHTEYNNENEIIFKNNKN